MNISTKIKLRQKSNVLKLSLYIVVENMTLIKKKISQKKIYVQKKYNVLIIPLNIPIINVMLTK